MNEAVYRCACGELVEEVYQCDFCHRRFCKSCYYFAEIEVGGGLNVKDTGHNCCYSCAEKSEVQIEILKEAKELAEGQLKLAEREHRKTAGKISVDIAVINQKLIDLNTNRLL